jgi:hypothetical protein
MATNVATVRVHDLKTLPVHFADVLAGDKRAEIRKNDRPFALGDFLILREWIDDAHASNYSGRFILARVTHVLAGPEAPHGARGLAVGYVSLSIDVVGSGGLA